MATRTGTSASETLYGTNGHDLFVWSGGNDLLNGGLGIDTVTYDGNGGNVVVNLDTGTASKYALTQTGTNASGFPTFSMQLWGTDTLREIENAVGTRYNDTLTGNGLANTLTGLGGADTIDGSGGVDTVNYSASNARVIVDLFAGTGTGGHAEGDRFTSIENVTGSNFNDIMIGSGSDNRFEGLGGADTFVGLSGRDVFDGGTEVDTVDYSASPGGVVVDLTNVRPSGGMVNNDAGGDTFFSVENIVGSDLSDWLYGTAESNHFRGRGGNDFLIGQGGADILDGGEQTDTVDYRESSAVIVNLSTNSGIGGHAQGDTYILIENITASEGHDTLTGNDVSNQLDGMGGDDVLAGLGGADRIYGGEGIDTADYSAAPGANFGVGGITVNLTTGLATASHAQGDTFLSVENITGTAFTDTLTGNSEQNTLNGGAQNDTLAGLGGADTLIGGEGASDTATYALSALGVTVNLATNVNAFGDAAGDMLFSIEGVVGSKYNDTITGDSNDNNLDGSDGSDTLIGGSGHDRLFGGEGTDTLEGGFGRDNLNGGGGRDTFAYNSGADSIFATHAGSALYDQIRNFESGTDRLDLRSVDANSVLSGDQAFTVVSGFTGRAGELTLNTTAVGDGDEITMLLGDVNGDRTADFAIEFYGNLQAGATSLVTAADILL